MPFRSVFFSVFSSLFIVTYSYAAEIRTAADVEAFGFTPDMNGKQVFDKLVDDGFRKINWLVHGRDFRNHSIKYFVSLQNGRFVYLSGEKINLSDVKLVKTQTISASRRLKRRGGRVTKCKFKFIRQKILSFNCYQRGKGITAIPVIKKMTEKFGPPNSVDEKSSVSTAIWTCKSTKPSDFCEFTASVRNGRSEFRFRQGANDARAQIDRERKALRQAAAREERD